jgi:hypothetical protein
MNRSIVSFSITTCGRGFHISVCFDCSQAEILSASATSTMGFPAAVAVANRY